MTDQASRPTSGPQPDGTWGVLLMAYGSPSRPEEIAAYYTHIRGGRPPSTELLEELRERYAAIGGRSPLPEITERQAAALERRLNAGGGSWRVYVGMRHWQPWIADAVRRMADDGIRRAVGLALAPHDSRMSAGAYVESARQALDALEPERRPAVRFVRSWATHPLLADALARRLQAVLEQAGGEPVALFTAHSLPERILSWDDPYPREVEATCRAIVERVGLEPGRWRIAYQSQGRTAEPWLGPTLESALQECAQSGARQVVVCPVGFVADHLEVLYDIDIEARALANRLGLRLERTPSFNDAPDFIEVLADVVMTAASGQGPEAGEEAPVR